MNRRILRGVCVVAAAGLSLAGLCGAGGGCGAIVSRSSNLHRSGTYVDRSTFGQIKTGKSTRDFVTATLGEPQARTPLEKGGEIWRWSYVDRKAGSGHVFLLYDGSTTKETVHTYFVQFDASGVVTKKWRS
jgi:outer membrane protein assembly factor BamE (lipoprotein component of BamABCDE complex)